LPRKKVKYEDVSQYDPKIHTKTKGGLGFGMKKNFKQTSDFESSGLHLIEVFKWSVPPELKEKYKEFKEFYA